MSVTRRTLLKTAAALPLLYGFAEKIVVVKSTIHYRAAFEPLAHAIVEVDAPGLSSSNLSRFPFVRVRRPIFPLDPI